MKLEKCNTCQQFNEKEDMEVIDGYNYCYNCYGFCDSCNKPIPTTGNAGLCSRCNKDE